MALAYPNATKVARMNAIVTLLGSAGKLVIGTSALSGATGVLASVPLANPAGTVAGAGVLTLTVPQSIAAAAAGTAAKAELRDNAGTVVATLSVGTSGADVIINNASITAGQTVQLTVGSLTHG